jgi:hypothetical protein
MGGSEQFDELSASCHVMRHVVRALRSRMLSKLENSDTMLAAGAKVPFGKSE